MDLHLEHEYSAENVALIRMAGELDSYTSAKLRVLVIEVINAGCYRLVLDLSRIEYLDSTGMGVIVGALKRCTRCKGDVALVIRTWRIMKIFKTPGLYKVFPIFDSPDNALTALAATTRPKRGFHPDLEHFNFVSDSSLARDPEDGR